MRGHVTRSAYFMMIGGGVFLLNIAVVQLFVTGYGYDPIAVYPFALAGAIALNYTLNQRVTWNDRHLEHNQCAWRFAILRVSTEALGYVLFIGLIHIPVFLPIVPVSLSAQVIAGLASGFLNYMGTHHWAFVEQPAAAKWKEAVIVR